MTLLPRPRFAESRDPRVLWRKWMRGELEFTRTMALVTAVLMVAFAGDMVRYTIAWRGYAEVVAVLIVLLFIALRRRKPALRLRHLPLMLLLFMGWCLVTILWSRYRVETGMASLVQVVTAFAGLAIAVSLTRYQFIRAAGVAFRGLVYGSLVFELYVALVSPSGVIPPSYTWAGDMQRMLDPTTPGTPGEMPAHLYWSFGNLLSGGALQGLMGNRNLFAMVALLALIVTVAELWDRRLRPIAGGIGVAAALFAIARTTSATVLVAGLFVGLAVVLVVLGRRIGRRWRWVMYGAVGTALVVGAVLVVVYNNEVFAQMNRTSDMSGRGTIWRSVIALGSTAPLLGIGWISYWAPWLPEFSSLAVIDGAAHHQAHNAFLDVWMQTGAVGLVLFAVLVFATLIRTWWVAIDRPDTPLVEPLRERGRPHLAGATAVPFLFMVALVVQAMTESRLLVEGGWLLLAYCAIYAKLRVQDPVMLPRRTGGERTGPIGVIVDPVRDL
ncbi:MAG: O-antigen ligase family protein [Microbacteriaceae bacterium]|nr:O-antigen ligase family protein [Microbacteriaceae bacterium]